MFLNPWLSQTNRWFTPADSMKEIYLSTYVNAGDRSAAVTIRTRPKHCLWGNSIALKAFLDGTLKHLWDRFMGELEMTFVRGAELSKQHLMKLGTGACMSLRRRGRRRGGQTSPEALVFKHDEKVARPVKFFIFLKLHVMWSLPILLMLNEYKSGNE